ncbi:MAG: hypothetical protein QW794_08550 [Thermosphaera sp.]
MMKAKLGELESTVVEVVRDITGKLVLLYSRAEDDSVRSQVDIAFSKCAQLLRNSGKPGVVLALLRELLDYAHRLGVEVDEQLVRRAVELAQELAG